MNLINECEDVGDGASDECQGPGEIFCWNIFGKEFRVLRHFSIVLLSLTKCRLFGF